MFTGLIQAIGTVSDVARTDRMRRVGIRADWGDEPLRLGESIAIDGACFTVTAIDGPVFHVDVSPESLERTTIGRLKRSDRVHLERALRLSDRLGGHLVLGHVDGTGTLLRRRPEAGSWAIEFSAPRQVGDMLIPKGSIAVNGVSLTVNTCAPDGFSVMVVPFTAGATLLTHLSEGSTVNLETDVIGKYVARLLEPWAGGERNSRLRDLLEEHGFMF